MQTVLGVMSGTSLDGVDIAACQFWQENEQWNYSILAAKTYTYPKEWQEKLRQAPLLSGLELSLLHNELGRLFADYIQQFLASNSVKVDVIASHGHTIFHQPKEHLTLQIGSGAVIAALTKIDVINDFRVLDVALQGQGAPLVPIGDELLFHQYDGCINLGGFANISTQKNGKRIAWDICPVNIVLNAIALELGKEYDEDGKLARNGQLISDLLSYLQQLDYYQLSAPKSLGKEWVDVHVFSYLADKEWKKEDILHTFTEHIANIIAQEINAIAAQRILFTGGGTYNSYLLERIQQKTAAEIIIPDSHLINFKEALIFGLLGFLRYNEKENTLKTVTGALKNSIGGAWWKGS